MREAARPIDIGRANDEHFALMVGVGFDAVMLQAAENDGLRDRLGQVGIGLSGVRQAALTQAEATVDVDGRPWYRGPASYVFVSNAAKTLGGVTAFTGATPWDGRLHVGAVRADGRRQRLRLMVDALAGRQDGSTLASLTTGRHIVVDLDRSLPRQVDGGVRDRTDHLDIRCLPSAIAVAQP